MQTIIKHIATKFFALFGCLIFGLNVSAQENITIIPIGLGDHTTADGLFSDNYYSFTAPEEGTLTIFAKQDVPGVYTDSTFTVMDEKFEFAYANGGQQRTGTVLKDSVYYIFVEPWDPITFTLSILGGDVKPEATYIVPEAGSVFPVSDNGLVALRFNKNILYDSAKMVCSNGEKDIDGALMHGTYSFNIRSQLFDWMNTGIVKPGDEFYFVMTNVRDAGKETTIYGDNGTFSVKYIVPEMPIVLESENIPETFLSYWPVGGEEGLVTLNFSGEVAEGVSASLSWGNAEAEGEYYIEELPLKIEGKTITLDLRGVLRTKTTMLPGAVASYSTMRVDIVNVMDKKGNPCYTDRQGVVGSFIYTLDYKDVTGNLAFQFSPGAGKSLAGKKNLDLWINDASLVYSYSGVNAEYTTADNAPKNEFITKDMLSVSSDADGLFITIPLSETIQTAPNVKISLAEVEYSDGIKRDIEATFNTTDTGIGAVTTGKDVIDGKFSVFTADGRSVMKAATKDNLKTLPKGVYVIDGQKFVVK